MSIISSPESQSILVRARSYLAKVPPAVSGQSGHNQAFAAACALVNGFALDEQPAVELLKEYNQRCVPPFSDREVLHKIKSAATVRHEKPRGYLLGGSVPPIAPKQPEPRPGAASVHDPVTAAEMFLAGFRCTEADLIERSPIKPPDDWQLGGLTLIKALFHPGENVNLVLDCSLSKDGKARPDGRGLTIERDLCLERRRDGFPMAKNGGWLRMNPIDGVGVNDANVTKFRYALVEFDKIPLELQFSLFGKLPLPVGAILTSGGRSVHAWVRVDAFDIEEYRELTAEFLAFLLRFGADGKNKNPSRLSRLPGVTRTTGASGDGAQKLIYCNPKPTNTPIFLCDTPF